MRPILDAVATGCVSRLDLWHATITPLRVASSSSSSSAASAASAVEEGRRRRYTHTFCCFFSVGFDANISHNFTTHREKYPTTCRYTWQNKSWYAWYGVVECIAGGRFIRPRDVELIVDGVFVRIPEDINTVQVFNIHSSADGVDFWESNARSVRGELQDGEFSEPCVCDKLLEVTGTRGVGDLVAIRVGARHSRRLAQGAEVQLRLKTTLPVQMDGETWMQEPCVVVIGSRGSAAVVGSSLQL